MIAITNTSDAITIYRKEARLPINSATVQVGKPPAFTTDNYVIFFQDKYRVAYANKNIEKENAFAKLSENLDYLFQLEDNWDSDGAEAPNTESIKISRQILGLIYETDLIPTAISPSVEGGVSIYFIKGDKYADFECFNSGEVLTSKSDRINEPEITELNNKGDVRAFLENIEVFLND
jgi:hypothetical protein